MTDATLHPATPKKTSIPLRAWCFTINNYTQADIDAILALDHSRIMRLAVGKEVAPSTGTPHLQGYVRFKKSARRGQVCLALGGRASCEPRYGTEAQATAYALKDKDVLVNFGTDLKSRDEEGPDRGAGARVIAAIDSGSTPREVWEANRVFFMYNARRVVDEFKRAKFYRENPQHSGFAPVDILGPPQ